MVLLPDDHFSPRHYNRKIPTIPQQLGSYMKINRKTLLAALPEQATDLLYQSGKTLSGTNLKRSSWLLIASGLHTHRFTDILLQRLEAAKTRQDALRVLRIARKAVPPRKASSRGASRPAPQENLLAVAADTSPQAFQEYVRDEEMLYEEMLDAAGLGQGDMEEWFAEQENTRPQGRARYPGLLPVSRTQDAIGRYAWERRPLESAHREDLRSRVDDDTYRRLLSLAHLQDGLPITTADRQFFQEHGLLEILDYAEFPSLDRKPICVQDGIALAGVRIIEDRAGVKGHPFAVDWKRLSAWLVERLIQKPDLATSAIVIAAAYGFFRDAPTPVLTRFLQQATSWHRAWTSLLWYSYPRITELLPDRPEPKVEMNWWGISGSHVLETPWERLLDAGTGSRLVLHNLMKNTEDLFHKRARMRNRYWNGARKVLMAGGGTLRRMDYPEFTLVCRPSISLVHLETFTELAKLATRLLQLSDYVHVLTRDRLAQWLESEYSAQITAALPEGLHLLIAGVLEHHAAAYLMLKERVLRDAFRAAPFRIRRKHIQRFWADQEAAVPGVGTPPFPTDFQAMLREFGLNAMKEALAHALLDHFKDDWGIVEEAAQPLKEALLVLLRSVALTYHINPPEWLRGIVEPITEGYLVYTQDVASFLIQQTDHAPLELAQALQLEPQQGLPRLAGGRFTHLEQNCRRLVKEIAGVSQKKLGEAEPRIFTCRPISKTQALDRGKLGGDCSSDSVPMRPLSPHHTYYGIFENGEQQRGYITVYEAGAEMVAEEGPSEHFPVLCLETINVPIPIFGSVQQDLLLIFEAIAKTRGLAEGLVLITGLGTWNYQNGQVLRQSRRFRQGQAVRLFPADPVGWHVYRLMAPEGERYTAFFDDQNARQYNGYFRLLAPFQPDLDMVEPENILEAQRIAALPPRELRIIAHGEKGPAGFISELPEIL